MFYICIYIRFDKVIAQSGLGLGIGIVFFTGLIACYTAHLILKHSYGHTDFSTRCKDVLGSWSLYISQLISVLIVLVAEISYHIFLSQNLHKVINAFIEFAGQTSPDWWTQKLCAAVVAIILLPLVLNPYPEIVIRASSYGIIAVITVAIIIIVTGLTPDGGIQFDDLEYAKTSFPKSIGVLSLSFFVHNVIFTIFVNPTHPEHNDRNLFFGYLIDMLVYAMVGAAGYLGYHKYKDPDTEEIKDISDNYLLMFSSKNVPIFVARLFLVIQMFITYPVIYRTFRDSLYSAFLPKCCFTWGTYCDCRTAHAAYLQEQQEAERGSKNGEAEGRTPQTPQTQLNVNNTDETQPLLAHVDDQESKEEAGEVSSEVEKKEPLQANFFLLQLPTAVVCIVITMLFAILYPSVGDITSYAGAICGFFYIFLLPCLLHIKLQYEARKTIPVSEVHSINSEVPTEHTDDQPKETIDDTPKKRQSQFSFVCDVTIHVILIIYGGAVVVMQFLS